MYRSSILSDYYTAVSENSGKTRGYLRVPCTKYDIPFTFIAGNYPCKTLLITGGIHSCKYVGMEADMRLAQQLNPASLHGNLLIFPIIKISGFRARQTALVPKDMKNLNRVFHVDSNGTLSEKIAAFLTQKVYPLADFYVDLHCGNQFEALVPHLYYSSLGVQSSYCEAAEFINVPYMVRSNSEHSTCGSAVSLGVSSLLIERGGNGRWNDAEVSAVLEGLDSLLKYLKITDGDPKRCCPQPLEGCQSFPAGLWYPAKGAGEAFKTGESLGILSDMMGSAIKTYLAPYNGVLLYQTATPWADDFGNLMAFGRTAWKQPSGGLRRRMLPFAKKCQFLRKSMEFSSPKGACSSDFQMLILYMVVRKTS